MADGHLVFTIGGGTTPAGVRLRELLGVLDELETALTSTARSMGDRKEPSIALTHVGDSTALYDLSTSRIVQQAAVRIGEAIATRNSELLPQAAVHSLNELHKKAVRLKRPFALNNGSLIAEIQPSVPLFSDPLIAGSTSLHAYVNAVGGAVPTARLLLSNGDRFTAEIASPSLGKELAAYLYEHATLGGDAWWHARTMNLTRFRIREIGNYRDNLANPVDAFAALRSAASDAWDDIDPDDYIRQLRDDSSE